MTSDQCGRCRWYVGRKCCLAFPDGIPEEIWFGKKVHDEPVEGDRGIRFEEMKDEG